MSAYTVTAERSGKWWVLQAQEAPGAISQVARLDQADQIREAIAFVIGEPEDTIEYDLLPILPQPVQASINWAAEYRARAAEANRLAAVQSRLAAHILADAGLTMRDIGTVLGVSYQRAQQLATAELPEGLQPQDADGGIGTPYAIAHITEPEAPVTIAELDAEPAESGLRGVWVGNRQ